jgi:hypothetical protein
MAPTVKLGGTGEQERHFVRGTSDTAMVNNVSLQSVSRRYQ